MPLTKNNENHKDLIDRIRKRKCFAEKDFEEIISDKYEQQMSTRFLQEQFLTHNITAFHEPKIIINSDNSEYTFSHNNSINTPDNNSIMQYYSMCFMYLLNNQSFIIGPKIDSSKIDSSEYQNEGSNSSANKNFNRVTNFSVDALLNVT